jgi:hypothetical protein
MGAQSSIGDISREALGPEQACKIPSWTFAEMG